jgi:hypothetical protein
MNLASKKSGDRAKARREVRRACGVLFPYKNFFWPEILFIDERK